MKKKKMISRRSAVFSFEVITSSFYFHCPAGSKNTRLVFIFIIYICVLFFNLTIIVIIVISFRLCFLLVYCSVCFHLFLLKQYPGVYVYLFFFIVL